MGYFHLIMINFGTTKFVPSSTLHRCCSSKVKGLWDWAFNPLSPSIHIQILQTDLHTSPLRISWENKILIKHQGIFSFMIIFYILTTLSLDNVLTLLALKAGLKGLKRVSSHVGFLQVYVKCCSILYLLLLINAVKDKCSHTIMFARIPKCG